MSVPADRRPWLILSRTEALALQDAALESLAVGRGLRAPSVALKRALRMVDNQLRWIDGSADGEPNDIKAALRREEQATGRPVSTPAAKAADALESFFEDNP